MTKRFYRKLDEVDVPEMWMYTAVSKRTQYLIALRVINHEATKASKASNREANN